MITQFPKLGISGSSRGHLGLSNQMRLGHVYYSDATFRVTRLMTNGGGGHSRGKFSTRSKAPRPSGTRTSSVRHDTWKGPRPSTPRSDRRVRVHQPACVSDSSPTFLLVAFQREKEAETQEEQDAVARMHLHRFRRSVSAAPAPQDSAEPRAFCGGANADRRDSRPCLQDVKPRSKPSTLNPLPATLHLILSCWHRAGVALPPSRTRRATTCPTRSSTCGLTPPSPPPRGQTSPLNPPPHPLKPQPSALHLILGCWRWAGVALPLSRTRRATTSLRRWSKC